MVGRIHLVIQYHTKCCNTMHLRDSHHPMQGRASADLQRGRHPVNMISFDFDQFNLKSFPSAQVWTCASSLAQVLELAAETIT